MPAFRIYFQAMMFVCAFFCSSSLLADTASGNTHPVSSSSSSSSSSSLDTDSRIVRDWILSHPSGSPITPAGALSAGLPQVISPPVSLAASQRSLLNVLPAGNEKTPAAESDADAAFNAMVQQNMPLSPRQVVKLHQLIDQSQRAAAMPATVPPRPVSSTLMMDLSPGTTPPAIRLARGYVSTLVFVDSAGAPWPIASYDLGDPKSSNIQWDGKSNLLLVQALFPYGDSDMVVRLRGLNTPVVLELVSGQRVVDYRTDIHVPGLGPLSKHLPVNQGLPPPASPALLSVLDGVAPSGSQLLSVQGGACQAFRVGDRMYLRTRLTVLSPGWISRMTSPDGMIAYEMQLGSSVLVSRYGEPVLLRIEGF